MKITYYGTAAGEAWPGVFCECELCREAIRRGGKNIRTRSQALIDDDLLLDLPPDMLYHRLQYGLDIGPVRSLLFTHSHNDHCYPEDLELLREPYSHTRQPMAVFGNGAVEQKVLHEAGEGSEHNRFSFTRLAPGDTVETAGYRVLALRATHTPKEECLFYRIGKGGKSVLYAHDTGALTEENLRMLREAGGVLSLVSLDCTQQLHRDGHYHMGIADAAEQKELLLREHLADENTVFVLNHFSHNGGLLHEEMERHAADCGMLAAYDGLSIEF